MIKLAEIVRGNFLRILNESNSLFSQMEVLPLEIEPDKDVENELFGDDVSANSNKLKSTPITPDKLTDLIKKSETQSFGIKSKGKIPYIHKQTIRGGYITVKGLKRRIAGIKNENGKNYNLDILRNMIIKRPNEILLKNEKMQHGDGKLIQFFNIGLPASLSLVYNEDKSEFIIVNTCPGAGSCLIDCYALAGNYIMTPNTAMSRAKMLNFILNDPEGFKSKLIQELSNKQRYFGKKNVEVRVRWHDAGDFFSDAYLKMAIEIAKMFPLIKFYAYTKMSSAAKSSMPDNFLVRFSVGAKPSEQSKMDFEKDYHAEVVPFYLIKHLFVLAHNHKPKIDSKRKWIFKEPIKNSKEELKRIIAKEFDVDINDLLFHDEYLRNKNKFGIKSKYHVIIVPGESDLPASEKNVKAVYNLEH